MAILLQRFRAALDHVPEDADVGAARACPILSNDKQKFHPMSIGPKLDRLDFRILMELQRNGRVTNVDLADAVGLSPSPCLSRVKRLEKAGYITGYGAQIALAKLGSTLTVFTQITLKDHRANDFSRFEQRARRISEIVECHLISGGYDYLVKFITRDVAHYQETIEGILEGDFGIEKYFSYIVIKSPIVKNYNPIEELFEARPS